MCISRRPFDPLSARSMVNTCPVLLYSCENWVLTKELHAALERFKEAYPEMAQTHSWGTIVVGVQLIYTV